MYGVSIWNNLHQLHHIMWERKKLSDFISTRVWSVFSNNPELSGMGIRAIESWVIVQITKTNAVSKRRDTDTNNLDLISTNEYQKPFLNPSNKNAFVMLSVSSTLCIIFLSLCHIRNKPRHDFPPFTQSNLSHKVKVIKREIFTTSNLNSSNLSVSPFIHREIKI